MRSFLFLIVLLSYSFVQSEAQQEVHFYSKDSLKIRGDLYLKDNSLPFIILCHQIGSNRSEFYELAPRLLNLNYNCIAIDHSFTLDAVNEIRAAIKFIQTFSKKPVILFGCSHSASLCLLVAAGNTSVKAVVALNPGEYFQPYKNVSVELLKVKQPVFVCSTEMEIPYHKKLFSELPPDQITLFKPEKFNSLKGPKVFSDSNPDNGEYWFALMMFFKKFY